LMIRVNAADDNKGEGCEWMVWMDGWKQSWKKTLYLDSCVKSYKTT